MNTPEWIQKHIEVCGGGWFYPIPVANQHPLVGWSCQVCLEPFEVGDIAFIMPHSSCDELESWRGYHRLCSASLMLPQNLWPEPRNDREVARRSRLVSTRGEEMKSCCERDHDGDGNCDVHRIFEGAKRSIPKKPTLHAMLQMMTDPRKGALLAIYMDHKALFHYAKGSSHNHQAWEGGYADHIAEIIRFNMVTWPALNAYRPLPFTMDSATVCLFLHDVEKLFRYGFSDHPEVKRWTRFRSVESDFDGVPLTWEGVKGFILADWYSRYGFSLTADEENALQYTHGEGSDYRVACPLAAHVHHCDNISARVYPEAGQGLG